VACVAMLFGFPKRIRSVLHLFADPQQVASDTDRLVCGDVILNLRTRSAERNSQRLNLTSEQFDLLALLAREQGRVFSRDEIIATIHGSHLSGALTSHIAITSHINEIRGKLETDPANPKYLQTVIGRGYRLVNPDGK
jgi:DNA-binding response OmpR family regulator